MRIPVLVLQKFAVNRSNNGKPAIEIVGRPGGIASLFLALVGLNAETVFTVSDLFVTIRTASVQGEFTSYIPLPHVSSSLSGFTKPIGFIVAAAILFFMGLMALLQRDGGTVCVVFLIIAAIFLVAYFLSKKLSIGLISDAGLAYVLRFKPKIVADVDVNIETINDAIALMNEKIIAASL